MFLFCSIDVKGQGWFGELGEGGMVLSNGLELKSVVPRFVIGQTVGNLIGAAETQVSRQQNQADAGDAVGVQYALAIAAGEEDSDANVQGVILAANGGQQSQPGQPSIASDSDANPDLSPVIVNRPTKYYGLSYLPEDVSFGAWSNVVQDLEAGPQSFLKWAGNIWNSFTSDDGSQSPAFDTLDGSPIPGWINSFNSFLQTPATHVSVGEDILIGEAQGGAIDPGLYERNPELFNSSRTVTIGEMVSKASPLLSLIPGVGEAEAVSAAETAGGGANPLVVDLFGGRTSQIPGAINVDIAAEQGVRASATQLPFADGSIGQVIASNPYIPGGSGALDYLPEAARVLAPDGQIIINSTVRNPFGTLPSAEALNDLGLQVVADRGPLLPQFSNNVFRFTDGNIIPNGAVRTTILQKVP